MKYPESEVLYEKNSTRIIETPNKIKLLSFPTGPLHGDPNVNQDAVNFLRNYQTDKPKWLHIYYGNGNERSAVDLTLQQFDDCRKTLKQGTDDRGAYFLIITDYLLRYVAALPPTSKPQTDNPTMDEFVVEFRYLCYDNGSSIGINAKASSLHRALGEHSPFIVDERGDVYAIKIYARK